MVLKFGFLHMYCLLDKRLEDFGDGMTEPQASAAGSIPQSAFTSFSTIQQLMVQPPNTLQA